MKQISKIHVYAEACAYADCGYRLIFDEHNQYGDISEWTYLGCLNCTGELKEYDVQQGLLEAFQAEERKTLADLEVIQQKIKALPAPLSTDFDDEVPY